MWLEIQCTDFGPHLPLSTSLIHLVGTQNREPKPEKKYRRLLNPIKSRPSHNQKDAHFPIECAPCHTTCGIPLRGAITAPRRATTARTTATRGIGTGLRPETGIGSLLRMPDGMIATLIPAGRVMDRPRRP